VDDELINQRNTFCVGKSCLSFVFKGEVIEHFEDESPETWCFQDFNKLRNHAFTRHLQADFLIKREIEKQAKSYLKKQLVVAGNETVELFYHFLVFHFIFIVSKYRKLFKEIQHNEKKVRVVAF
jgi:hypothetical protein